jgi:BASS family bile acid:Na+ symporter
MHFIRRYFGVFLLLSCLVGMVIPSVGQATSPIVIISLAFIIFCSFFQISFSRASFRADLGISLRFYTLRYLGIPVLAYFTFAWFSDFHALVLMLAFLLPAAVSSPSFTLMFGGKPELSLKILIISSFLSVLSIPLIMKLLLNSAVSVPAGKMLLTLVYTIVVPFIVHLPLRSGVVKKTMGRFSPLFTLIGLSLIFIVVTARNKPAILENPYTVGLFALEALLMYLLMYLIGYYLVTGQPTAVRRTLSISSGANNIGLGVTLTALFFPGDINIFFIVAQLVWVLMLIPLRRWHPGGSNPL